MKSEDSNDIEVIESQDGGLVIAIDKISGEVLAKGPKQRILSMAGEILKVVVSDACE